MRNQKSPLFPPLGPDVETVYRNCCAAICVDTYAVVAILVLLSLTAGVGAVGVPVNAGLAMLANGAIAVAIAVFLLFASFAILVK